MSKKSNSNLYTSLLRLRRNRVLYNVLHRTSVQLSVPLRWDVPNRAKNYLNLRRRPVQWDPMHLEHHIYENVNTNTIQFHDTFKFQYNKFIRNTCQFWGSRLPCRVWDVVPGRCLGLVRRRETTYTSSRTPAAAVFWSETTYAGFRPRFRCLRRLRRPIAAFWHLSDCRRVRFGCGCKIHTVVSKTVQI